MYYDNVYFYLVHWDPEWFEHEFLWGGHQPSLKQKNSSGDMNKQVNGPGTWCLPFRTGKAILTQVRVDRVKALIRMQMNGY